VKLADGTSKRAHESTGIASGAARYRNVRAKRRAHDAARGRKSFPIEHLRRALPGLLGQMQTPSVGLGTTLCSVLNLSRY